MERHQHAVVQILSHLGQVCIYASHKPELLTTSMMVFGSKRPTFGDKMIYIASYWFQFFFSCQHKTIGVLCEFYDFWGLFGHFYTLTGFPRHFMRIIQIWTTCTFSSAYKLVENHICVLGCMLRSHARNGNEFHTPCPRHSAANIEIPCFKF